MEGHGETLKTLDALLAKDKKKVEKFEKNNKNRDPEAGNPKLEEAR